MRVTAILSMFSLSLSFLPAHAGIPCMIVDAEPSRAGAVILITPSGAGPTLAEQDLIFNVQLFDCGMTPIEGFPQEDVFLASWIPGEIDLCPYGSMADADTDASGATIISGAIAGGGYTTEGAVVWASSYASDYGTPLPVQFVSPDFDADLDVDLADFSRFAFDFMTTESRSDLEPDGVVNLADFAVFGRHYGEQCP